MRNKIIILILSCLLSVYGFSQAPAPSGFASPYSTGYYRIGWLQSDSGSIPAYRDTNWIPKFQFTEIVWLRPGIDSSKWIRVGNRWIKELKQGDVTPAVWGSITGNLSNQTDLQNALNGKLSNITGYVQAGSNVTLSGLGTQVSPYVINSTASGTGTVTQFNFTNGNGLTGSVTNATTTPTLQLGTSLNGIVNANGTGFGTVSIGSGLNYSGGVLSATGGTSLNGLVSANGSAFTTASIGPGLSFIANTLTNTINNTNQLTNGAGFLTNITGLVNAGSNITITGSGTSGSPYVVNASGGGTGTVTTFSSGNLSPLFTTTVSNPNTTPALQFVLSNAAANSVFGNNTGSSSAPIYYVPTSTILNGWFGGGGIQPQLSGTGYVKFASTTPSYLTPTQVTADLNLFTTSLQGLVSAPGTATGKFLRDDNTWQTVTTGTVTSVGLTTPSFLTTTGSPITTSGTFSVTLATQTANTVFGNHTGSTAAPTFGKVVLADQAANTANYIQGWDGSGNPTALPPDTLFVKNRVSGTGVQLGNISSDTLYLNNLVAGTNITLTKNADSSITISASGGASGITSLNGLTGATQTFATGTSGTDFGISSSGTVHTFNLPIASSTNTGKLSNTDWSTFNGKQAALSGTGYVKFAGTTPSYLTPTQVTADLNLFTSTLQGLVPASGGGTTNFLRADGTWSIPGGGGTIGGTIAAGQVAYGTASNTIGGSSPFTYNSSTHVMNSDTLTAKTAVIDATTAIAQQYPLRVYSNYSSGYSGMWVQNTNAGGSAATELGVLNDQGFGWRLRALSSNFASGSPVMAINGKSPAVIRCDSCDLIYEVGSPGGTVRETMHIFSNYPNNLDSFEILIGNLIGGAPGEYRNHGAKLYVHGDAKIRSGLTLDDQGSGYGLLRAGNFADSLNYVEGVGLEVRGIIKTNSDNMIMRLDSVGRLRLPWYRSDNLTTAITNKFLGPTATTGAIGLVSAFDTASGTQNGTAVLYWGANGYPTSNSSNFSYNYNTKVLQVAQTAGGQLWADSARLYHGYLKLCDYGGTYAYVAADNFGANSNYVEGVNLRFRVVNSTNPRLDAFEIDSTGDIRWLVSPKSATSADSVMLIATNGIVHRTTISNLGTLIGGSSTNIYNTDGTLSANRTLSGGNFSLSLGTSGSPISTLTQRANNITLWPIAGVGGELKMFGTVEYGNAGTTVDANYTTADARDFFLGGNITATRTVNIPLPSNSGISGVDLGVYIQNATASTNKWIPSSALYISPYDSITSLATGASYNINSDGTRWNLKSTSPGIGLIIESSAASLTLATATDYVFNGTTSTFTLPSLNANQGRVYRIKNAGSGNLTISRSGTDNIYDASSVTTITIAAGSFRMISAGPSFWYAY